MSRTDYRSRPNSRPQSATDQLVELHVYMVTADTWRERYNNMLNQSVEQTISIGIVRVKPDVRLVDLRDDLVEQLEDKMPQDYVFLKSVGRSITKLKSKQEYTFKVKEFVPPKSYAPELFILEGASDCRTSVTSDADSRSQSSFRQLGDSPRSHGYNTFRDRDRDRGRDRDRNDYRDPGSKTYRQDDYNNKYRQANGTHRSPNRHAERGPGNKSENKGRSDPRSATYTTNTNTDSGIAESSPEDQYHRGRYNYEDDLERKRREMEERLARDKFDPDDDDSYRLEDMEDRDRIDRERWERDRDYRRQWIEEERQRREQEELRKKREAEEEEQQKMKRSASDEELARYPSPPELRMDSPRETESAKRRIQEEKEKLMQELDSARESRKHTEKEREELVKKAKQLQNKTQNRRNHARDLWKKRYFEEKKKTAPLEEQSNRLRHELDNIHRKLMTTLEGPKEKHIHLGEPKPSLKNNYIIQCTKLQHEIEDLQRRVENAKMKLTAEMKLRNQAEAELRALRAELTQKKINLTLTRNQQLAALNPSGEVPLNHTPIIAPQS